MTATTLPSVAVTLGHEIGERIKRLADARHRNMEGLVQEAVGQYVEREERRDSFNLDGARAWEDYQSSRMHLTHEEADGWLARLEAGEDVPPPPCHA